jgi:hypothetical protein
MLDILSSVYVAVGVVEPLAYSLMVFEGELVAHTSPFESSMIPIGTPVRPVSVATPFHLSLNSRI